MHYEAPTRDAMFSWAAEDEPVCLHRVSNLSK
jgi:hypothetical protein